MCFQEGSVDLGMINTGGILQAHKDRSSKKSASR